MTNRREIRGEFGGRLKKWVERPQHCPMKKQCFTRQENELALRWSLQKISVSFCGGLWPFSCVVVLTLPLLFEKVPVASSHCKRKACPRLVQGRCMSVFRPPQPDEGRRWQLSRLRGRLLEALHHSGRVFEDKEQARETLCKGKAAYKKFQGGRGAKRRNIQQNTR